MNSSGRLQRLVVLLAIWLALGLALGTSLAGCATTSPSVKVLGFTEGVAASSRSDSLVVFVEVVNPTQRELALSRLEYRLDARSWFQTDGSVVLSRVVAPGSSTVVEVPIRFHRLAGYGHDGQSDSDQAVSYSLRGRLWAMSEQVQRSWNVEVAGVLDAEAVADAHAGPASLHVRIAGSQE